MKQLLAYFRNHTGVSNLLSVVVCFAILFYRLPESFLDPDLVHTDSRAYLGHANNFGLSSLFVSVDGYLSLYTRIIVYLASHTPKLEGFLFSYGAHLGLLIVLLTILSKRTQLYAKPLVCIAVVLFPSKPYWVHASVVNIIWTLALLLPLLLVRKPAETRFALLIDCFLLTIAALSAAPILWIMPFFFWNYRKEPLASSRVLLFLAVFLWLVQFVLFLGTYQPRSKTPLGYIDWQAWLQVVMAMFSSPFVSPPISPLLAMLVIGFTATTFLALAYAFLNKKQLAPIAFLLIGLLSIVPPMITFHDNPRELYWHLDRFKYIPAVLFSWTIIQGLSLGRSWKILCSALLLVIGTHTFSELRLYVPADFEKECSVALEKEIGKCNERLKFRWYIKPNQN